jgi:hypothetical protein
LQGFRVPQTLLDGYSTFESDLKQGSMGTPKLLEGFKSFLRVPNRAPSAATRAIKDATDPAERHWHVTYKRARSYCVSQRAVEGGA